MYPLHRPFLYLMLLQLTLTFQGSPLFCAPDYHITFTQRIEGGLPGDPQAYCEVEKADYAELGARNDHKEAREDCLKAAGASPLPSCCSSRQIPGSVVELQKDGTRM
jgi:hypothetical protein